MTGQWNKAGSDGRRPKSRGAYARSAAVCLFLIPAGVAAQEARPVPPAPVLGHPAPPQPEAAPQQPPAFGPGFLDVLGRWIGESKSKIDEHVKSGTDVAKGAAKDATDAAVQGSGVILGLPGTRVVLGRERCAVAPNGGADCTNAAHALCRSKGFSAGRGLDIDSAQKCPAAVWLQGRQPPEGACPTETFVVRAVCQ